MCVPHLWQEKNGSKNKIKVFMMVKEKKRNGEIVQKSKDIWRNERVHVACVLGQLSSVITVGFKRLKSLTYTWLESGQK